MPEIGDIEYGRELGYKSKSKMKWQACPNCGKERWVEFAKSKRNSICRRCGSYRGILAIKEKTDWPEYRTNWKGGRNKNGAGYIRVWISKDSVFAPMATKDGYVLEHRLVMAKKIGRCLLKNEIVHHRPDVDKGDNREEVLFLIPNSSEHGKFISCSNCELTKEVQLLRRQLKEIILYE